jgi:hypothetical protein
MYYASLEVIILPYCIFSYYQIIFKMNSTEIYNYLLKILSILSNLLWLFSYILGKIKTASVTEKKSTYMGIELGKIQSKFSRACMSETCIKIIRNLQKGSKLYKASTKDIFRKSGLPSNQFWKSWGVLLTARMK